MNALEIRALSKRFGRVAALSGVSFDLPEGSVGGLVGPNGAGKTTLFSIVAGYLIPSAGTVAVFGQDSAEIRTRNGLLAILPQDARFLRQIPVRRLFIFYARLMGFDAEEAASEAQRVLETVDLADAGAMEGDRLSHGMRKCMAIAQALIGSPRLLLLDEPTAGLDPAHARTIRDLIRGLRGERTVLVSSHNLDEIADICDHVTVLDKGRLVESKAMAEFTGQQGLITLSLDAPADEAVLHSLRRIPSLAAVELSRDGRRVSCTLAAQDVGDPQVVAAIVSALAGHGLSFTDIRKGSTLEERFLEVTDKDRRP